jgi:hypothetical protein
LAFGFIFLGFFFGSGTGALSDFFGGVGAAFFFAKSFFARSAGFPLVPICAPFNNFGHSSSSLIET